MGLFDKFSQASTKEPSNQESPSKEPSAWLRGLAKTRAILTAIVLLLHQQEKLLESPKRRTVLLLKIRQRLQQPHQRNPAFVANVLAHELVTPAPAACGSSGVFSSVAA